MDDVHVELRLALGRVSRRLRKLYVDAESGPSFLELAVLQRLERSGTSTPSELAGEENVTSAAVAASLRSLGQRGLVRRTRDAADGRRVLLTLTAEGRRTLRIRDDACTERIKEVLAGFSSADRASMARAVPLLERLAKEL